MHLAPLIGLLAGILSAGLYIYGLTLTASSVFMMLLAPLPLWLAGLGWGPLAAGIAGATGAIGGLLVTDPMIASLYVAAFAIPVAVLCQLALARRADGGRESWFPANALLGSLVAVGLVQALVAALALSLTEAGLAGTVRENMIAVLGAFATEETAGSEAVVDQWDSLVLGLLVGTVMVAQAATAALAQGLLSASGRKQRPTPAFWALRLGDWTRVLMVPLLAAVVVADLAGSGAAGRGAFLLFLGKAFVLVLGVGFLVQGLAVMHALTRGMRVQPLVLAGVYFVALAMQPFGSALLALIGFFDRWGNFRERFGVEDADMED